MSDSREKNGANILKNIPEGFFTTNQAAEKVGCNPYTLRRWRTSKVFVPSQPPMLAGRLEVPLYSKNDIDLMVKLYRDRKNHVHQFPTNNNKVIQSFPVGQN